MPEYPHWYVKRRPENEAEYVELFRRREVNGILRSIEEELKEIHR
jgi:predicted peroxiredoxin